MLKEGNTAPDFTLPAVVGGSEPVEVGLSGYRGKKHVILIFYPKDNTPG